MFDGLRRREQRGIQHFLVVYILGDMFGFLDDAVDGFAIHAFGLFANHGEYLLKALNVGTCLPQMFLKSSLEFRAGGFFSHGGQVLLDLLLGVIDIFELVLEEVFHAFYVF
ncbi:hypothetical protein GCM10007276_20720 [Agaricicola taiwanensis]|uniref:Uncharacterized protein n=1 Tax=Agaricicola taiwanensis TaxID=591372 RepID=A0A8J3DWA4_9RHOB|nr:hypothetical protein GCM10007276_20720 [Agaricicola taiwanensis]